MTNADDNVHSPRIVNSQPFPMTAISGAPTMAPMHDKMFRHRLFSATPEDDRRGMNSVNIVVDIAKMSIDPNP